MIDEPELVEVPTVQAAAIHLTIPAMEMGKYMDPAITELLEVMRSQGQVPAGAMFSYHHRRPSDTFDFEIAFPVARSISAQGRVRPFQRPAMRVARTVYTGPYDGLSEGWKNLRQWVRDQGLAEDGRFWENYLTDPDEEPDPSKWRTELNWVIEERPAE